MNLYPPGTLIAGRYEVASRPLLGGMGIVYLCFDHQAQRPVALKTFRPEFLPDRAARDRFLREGTTWVNLGNHLHIVRCYTVVQPSASLEVYLVLELVAKEEGRRDASLRSWLTPGKPLPIDQALLFALQIVRGMRHAVEAIPGFVHRDLKPENVLVGADRLTSANVHRLRVTDFGLAAALQEMGSLPRATTASVPESGASPGRTQLTRGIVGTPLYMAPEQWRGKDVCLQSDIYALGCILYEMLAGQSAVGGNDLKAIEQAHCHGKVRPWPSSVPAIVREVVTPCLVLRHNARYGEWGVLEKALLSSYTELTGQVAPEMDPQQETETAERVAAGWSFYTLGNSYLDIGKAETALTYSNRARQISQAEHDRLLEAASTSLLGMASAATGDLPGAERAYEQALEILRAIDQRRWLAPVLSNLAGVYADRGESGRAIGVYEEALAIAREYGDQETRADGLIGLGIVHKNRGDLRRAIGFYEQALAIVQGTGRGRGEGHALSNLGNAYLLLGDTRRAIDYLKRALAAFSATADRRGEEAALGNLGSAYGGQGDLQQAGHFFEQALAIAREISDRLGEGNALGNLGLIYLNLGDIPRAVSYLQQALEIRRQVGDRMGLATDLFNLALLYQETHQLNEALPMAQQAYEIWSQIDSAYAQQASQLVRQIRAQLR